MMRGLFGKKMQMPGMGAGFAGMGGGIVATPEQEAESARLAAMFPNAGMPRDEITYTPQAQAIMSGEAPMPAKRGFDWKNVLLQTLGGAADGAATFFGGEPVIRQNMQMQQMMAMRQAEEQRRRAAELADYRTKLGIKQEFEQPDAPKLGSFEWFRTATPEQRAEYSRYMDVTNPVMTTTWQGPTIIPRSQGAPAAPVGRLTPIQPSIANAPAPQLGANGMPTTLTRQQYQAVVNSMGQADTEAWAQRNNIRVVD